MVTTDQQNANWNFSSKKTTIHCIFGRKTVQERSNFSCNKKELKTQTNKGFCEQVILKDAGYIF